MGLRESVPRSWAGGDVAPATRQLLQDVRPVCIAEAVLTMGTQMRVIAVI